jgi:hypothetical protein
MLRKSKSAQLVKARVTTRRKEKVAIQLQLIAKLFLVFRLPQLVLRGA